MTVSAKMCPSHWTHHPQRERQAAAVLLLGIIGWSNPNVRSNPEKYVQPKKPPGVQNFANAHIQVCFLCASWWSWYWAPARPAPSLARLHIPIEICLNSLCRSEFLWLYDGSFHKKEKKKLHWVWAGNASKRSWNSGTDQVNEWEWRGFIISPLSVRLRCHHLCLPRLATVTSGPVNNDISERIIKY